MAFFVFDLDGTLRDVSHRRKYVAGPKKDYRNFFLQSEFDPPIQPVIDQLRILTDAGHEVEIWSGCSDEVLEITHDWLDKHIGSWFDSHSQVREGRDLITRMRPAGDYTPDTELKEGWLKESIAEGKTPRMIFDDRVPVVEMWRRNGIVCAQVAPGDFDKKKFVPPAKRPILTMMIGPSGAGKSTVAHEEFVRYPSEYVSSDDIRRQQFGFQPKAYTTEGFNATFIAVRSIIESRLKGGLDVVYDATNLRRKNRVDLLDHLDFEDNWFDVLYVIVDRPLEQKVESWIDDEKPHTNLDIIKKHHDQFQASKSHALQGDGYDQIDVIDCIKN